MEQNEQQKELNGIKTAPNRKKLPTTNYCDSQPKPLFLQTILRLKINKEQAENPNKSRQNRVKLYIMRFENKLVSYAESMKYNEPSNQAGLPQGMLYVKVYYKDDGSVDEERTYKPEYRSKIPPIPNQDDRDAARDRSNLKEKKGCSSSSNPCGSCSNSFDNSCECESLGPCSICECLWKMLCCFLKEV